MKKIYELYIDFDPEDVWVDSVRHIAFFESKEMAQTAIEYIVQEYKRQWPRINNDVLKNKRQLFQITEHSLHENLEELDDAMPEILLSILETKDFS